MNKLSYFRRFLMCADITVAMCNHADWFDFKFTAILQQKVWETEKRLWDILLQACSHLRKITALFLKITEVILEDYKVPALDMRKTLHY